MRDTLDLSHYKGSIEDHPVMWHIGHDGENWYVMGASFPVTEAAPNALLHVATDDSIPDGSLTYISEDKAWRLKHGELYETAPEYWLDRQAEDKEYWGWRVDWLYEMENCSVEASYRNTLKSVLETMEW